MPAHLPQSSNPRIVIIGAGFGGLKLARSLAKKAFQVVLIDKNNFHQFQPLFYQVATSGIAPSAIAFPIRKVFHHVPNVHFRMAEVKNVDTVGKKVQTDVGSIDYDHLVIATGADTNYFGNKQIEKNALPMKSVQESLVLRNQIIQRMEDALISEDNEELKRHMTLVVVGGGPTGVEVSGALAEMKRFVLPKDYPELDFDQMEIHLLEASPRLLNGMSEKSSDAARKFLLGMGVKVHTGAMVESYDGREVKIKDAEVIGTSNLIWAAGIRGNTLKGIPDDLYSGNGRLEVTGHMEVKGLDDVYAIGDIALLKEEAFPKGHPQVAQVAMQQASWLASYFISGRADRKGFTYSDLGSMATIGRSRAVVELPFYHFQGFIAWLVWLFVHLMSIVGVKNRFFIFIDWMSYYINFNQNLRLVIRQKEEE